ncbi:MAG TPA: hypothetical protein VHC22_16330 [Pirellulales bacterium]|nr:hypothetical protein [Pirellulales bacterium]
MIDPQLVVLQWVTQPQGWIKAAQVPAPPAVAFFMRRLLDRTVPDAASYTLHRRHGTIPRITDRRKVADYSG